ncbi:natural resistance-associated macrophage protein-domain-containing protein [Dipodascopsis uninucleata]
MSGDKGSPTSYGDDDMNLLLDRHSTRELDSSTTLSDMSPVSALLSNGTGSDGRKAQKHKTKLEDYSLYSNRVRDSTSVSSGARTVVYGNENLDDRISLEMYDMGDYRNTKMAVNYDDSGDLEGRYGNGRRDSEGFDRSAVPRIRSSFSWRARFENVKRILIKYIGFIGPGFMVAVAYIDPGNYSTAVAAGAMFKYKLLFVVLLSNFFSIFLQALCAKLGSVTGLDLAQNCREHFPRWLCIILYILAEIAIIATDLAEVIGTAIALNILFKTPLVVGVALTIIDVLIVLCAYSPTGSLKGVRLFEYAVAALVFGVVICFCVELSKVKDTSAAEVFMGFLPSRSILSADGLYYSCGILGATVMPHSLYLGSGLVQPRLKEFDIKYGNCPPQANEDEEVASKYKPSLAAIRDALKYSIVELAVSLLTFALFVNSAILIVSGATLTHAPEDVVDADLFSIHEMLSSLISKGAGTVFALALLLSGQSAGIVCTLAGQMVSEGFLHWTMTPWLRRLITRSIAVIPCITMAGVVGRQGLADILNFSQVILSCLLPFVTAPLIYFTCSKKYMRVPVVLLPESSSLSTDEVDQPYGDNVDYHEVIRYVDMSNGKIVSFFGIFIWLFISGLNIYLISTFLLKGVY